MRTVLLGFSSCMQVLVSGDRGLGFFVVFFFFFFFVVVFFFFSGECFFFFQISKFFVISVQMTLINVHSEDSGQTLLRAV